MFELCPILTRVVIVGSVPSGMSKEAASMLGFFSIRIAIDSVLGMLLLIPTGTTAPFSAMSGVWKKTMSLLCAGSPPPSAFIVSARLWVSNAALFHACACAAGGASMPAPPRSENRVTPLPVFNRLLRFRFIDLSPKFEAAFYAFIAHLNAKARISVQYSWKRMGDHPVPRSPGGPSRLRETRVG